MKAANMESKHGKADPVNSPWANGDRGASPEMPDKNPGGTSITTPKRRTRHSTRSQQAKAGPPSSQQGRSHVANASALPGVAAKANRTAQPTVASDKHKQVTPVGECAAILASLDEEGYRRDLMQDSNSLLENIVFPMCFPWQHRGKGIPVGRNIPCDIDEMPIIVAASESEFSPMTNGPLGYGRFDGGQMRTSTSKHPFTNSKHPYRAAVRRDFDVGVVELTEYTPSHQPIRANFRMMGSSGTLQVDGNDSGQDDGNGNNNTGTNDTNVNNGDDNDNDNDRDDAMMVDARGPTEGSAEGAIIDINFKTSSDADAGADTNTNASNDARDGEGPQLAHGPLDGPPPGTVALQCFNCNQERKRQRQENEEPFIRKRRISIRIANTSSRVSVFPQEKSILVFNAQLPQEINVGRFGPLALAKKTEHQLGSYNCRNDYDSIPTAKSHHKVQAGRIRRVWTHKMPHQPHQKVAYVSCLTGERLDSNGHKRPRQIKVSIRINGDLIDAKWEKDCIALEQEEPIGQSLNALQCKLHTEPFVHSIKQDILKAAQQQKKKKRGEHSTNTSSSSSSRQLISSNKSYSIVLTEPRLDSALDVTCTQSVVCTHPGTLLDANSLDIHELITDSCRPSATRQTARCAVCWSACAATIDQASDTLACGRCGMTVHSKCSSSASHVWKQDNEVAPSDSTSSTVTDWTCTICADRVQPAEGDAGPARAHAPQRKSRRSSRIPARLQDSQVEYRSSRRSSDASISNRPSEACSLCPYTGGSMSVSVDASGKKTWTHDTCRVWAGKALAAPRFPHIRFEQRCALCGIGGHGQLLEQQDPVCAPNADGGGLIKCAAARCRVFFHPMCAVLSSLLKQAEAENSHERRRNSMRTRGSRNGSGSKKGGKDEAKELHKFSLRVVKCRALLAHGVYDKQPSDVQHIPVGFCSFHNPERRRAQYGLYPNYLHMNKNTVRIPSTALHYAGEAAGGLEGGGVGA